MKKVLLLLSGGFEIYEASVFIDVIGWNQVDGDGSTSLETCAITKEVKSSFNHRFIVDHIVDEVNADDFDALAIPGGFEKFDFYKDAFDERFLTIIRMFEKQGKLITSVCAGALPLAKAGILNNKKGTTFCTRQESLKPYGVKVVNEPIVIEGNIITSWNPSTAMDVALYLLAKLSNQKNADYIREIMGFKPSEFSLKNKVD